MRKASIITIVCIILILIISIIGVSCNNRTRVVIKKAACESNAVYQLKYRTIYDDLTFKDEWVDVSKAEYDEYEKIKNSGG